MPHTRSRQLVPIMIGSSLLFLLIGLGLIASASFSVSTSAQLRADGRTITAEVVDAQVTRSTRRGSVTSTRYEIKYRFQPPGHAVVTSGWEEAPEDIARTAAQTRTIDVRYLPGDPSVNLPSASVGKESGSDVTSVWRSIVGAAFALLGLGIGFLALKGQPAPGPSPRQSVMPTHAR
jgi:hypothetical protein